MLFIPFFDSIFWRQNFQKMNSILKFIFIVWLLAVFVLRQFISGDLFSNLVKKADPGFLDSWNDLLAVLNKNEFPIHALNPNLFLPSLYGNSVQPYFDKESRYHQEFEPRMKLMPFSLIDRSNFSQYIIEMTNKNTEIAMFPYLLLKCALENYVSGDIEERWRRRTALLLY